MSWARTTWSSVPPLAGYEIDGAVNIYAGCYNNPFLIWGKYRKKWLRATLPVSFQFHHTQLDGIPAAEFPGAAPAGK